MKTHCNYSHYIVTKPQTSSSQFAEMIDSPSPKPSKIGVHVLTGQVCLSLVGCKLSRLVGAWSGGSGGELVTSQERED